MDAATEILERMLSRIQRTSMVLQVAGSASWSELPEFSMLLDQRTSTLVQWHKPVRCAMLSSLSRTLAPGPLPCTVPFKFNPMHSLELATGQKLSSPSLSCLSCF